MKVQGRALIVWLFAGWCAGCAAIVHGTTQQVRIETTPPGATATVGEQSITTPGELTLPREYPFIVNFDKPGYVPTYVHVERATSNLVWGDVLLGGFMGAAIDYSSGAAYELEPSIVTATLAPIATGDTPDAPPGATHDGSRPDESY